jgi:uncharacterized membrane protein YphA (DoxX/SURF4 family)
MTAVSPVKVLDVVLSPSPAPARAGSIALAALRILVGVMWLVNVIWKVPPDFGEKTRGGLYFWTHLAVDHPVFGPYSWLVEHLVLPNFTVFGWLVFVVETLLAVLLLTGTAVRLAALLGIGQSLAIGLSVAEAPNEWPWAYAMMAGIHLVLLLAPSAQYAAVDAVRAAARTGNAPPIARRLLGGWGVVLAVLAVLAALSIYVQIGRTEVWLGGTPTTAAVFVCAVVVAVGARPVRTASAQNQGG